MGSQFSPFAPEAMRALAGKLALKAQQRAELLRRTRDQTRAMLGQFGKARLAEEDVRRHDAARRADSRRLFISELRTSSNALLKYFRMNRRETAVKIAVMAAEVQAASKAWRRRHMDQAQPAPSRAEGANPPGTRRKSARAAGP